MTRTTFIFDCDGVLLDSISAWHSLDSQMADEAGIVLTDEDRAALNASILSEAAEYFHERYNVGESAQQVERRFMEILLDYYRNHAAEVPGALAFVRAARAAGIPTYVLSSSPNAFLQPGLQRAGFTGLMDRVFSVEDLPRKKRDPLLYPYLCDLLDTTPGDIWFFDDSFYACRTAHEAGLNVVGVYSADECGSHEELAENSVLVVDDFLGLTVESLLAGVVE